MEIVRVVDGRRDLKSIFRFSRWVSRHGGSIQSDEESSSLSASEAQATTSAATNDALAQAEEMNALIKKAGKDFDEYPRLTSAGKLGEVDQKVKVL